MVREKVNRSVFVFIVLCVILALFGPKVWGQEVQPAPPKAEVHAWFDFFAGNQVPTIYPQYGWKAPTRIGTFSGYGFLQRAPKEPMFANNLVILTPGRQKIFSVRTETGGRVAEFRPTPDKIVPPGAFFQIGPQIHLQEVVRPMKKGLKSFVVTWLPKTNVSGIRVTNYLIGFGTQPVKFGGTEVRLEGFRRFFPKQTGDYAEYWLLVHPKRAGPFTAGAWVLHHGKTALIGFGGRFSPF